MTRRLTLILLSTLLACGLAFWGTVIGIHRTYSAREWTNNHGAYQRSIIKVFERFNIDPANDATHDDGPGLRRLLQQQVDQHQKIIWIPVGTYNLTSTLELPPHSLVVGSQFISSGPGPTLMVTDLETRIFGSFISNASTQGEGIHLLQTDR